MLNTIYAILFGLLVGGYKQKAHLMVLIFALGILTYAIVYEKKHSNLLIATEKSNEVTTEFIGYFEEFRNSKEIFMNDFAEILEQKDRLTKDQLFDKMVPISWEYANRDEEIHKRYDAFRNDPTDLLAKYTIIEDKNKTTEDITYKERIEGLSLERKLAFYEEYWGAYNEFFLDILKQTDKDEKLGDTLFFDIEKLHRTATKIEEKYPEFISEE